MRVRNGRLTLAEPSTVAACSAARRRALQPRAEPRRARLRRHPQRAERRRAPASDGFTIDSVGEIVFDNVVVVGGGKQLRLDLEGALAGDTFEVERLALSSGATSLNGSGTVTSIQRRDGTFSMQSPLIDVDEVLAVLAALVPADPSATGMSALAGEDAERPHLRPRHGTLKVDRGQRAGLRRLGARWRRSISRAPSSPPVRWPSTSMAGATSRRSNSTWRPTARAGARRHAHRDQRRQARGAVRQRRRSHGSAGADHAGARRGEGLPGGRTARQRHRQRARSPTAPSPASTSSVRRSRFWARRHSKARRVSGSSGFPRRSAWPAATLSTDDFVAALAGLRPHRPAAHRSRRPACRRCGPDAVRRAVR